MIGTLSFSLIMVIFSVLSLWWLNGKLPKIVQNQQNKKSKSEGRQVDLKLFGRLVSFRLNQDFWVRVTFMALGPSAVTGLSIAYAQILPLRVVFVLFVLPAYLAMLVLGIVYPKWGRRAAIGFVAGVLATIMYDVVRLILAFSLGLPDPIPHIGDLWLGADTVSGGNLWWVGYLWRFFGNGAGLGIAYAMLPRKWFSLKGGWIYGDLVGLGMFAVLFFFPASQLHLFPLNLTVLVNGILGHWAYGLALGWLFVRSKLIVRTRPLTWANNDQLL